MRKHTETFSANKVFKCQTLFAQKPSLAHPYFLHENESLQHFFPYDLRKMAAFLVFEVRFFQRVRFLGAQFFLGPAFWSGFGF